MRTAAEPRTLSAAYERCRQLHARHGRTYYLATLLLPRWKRRHVHALYGFTRYADEIVDDPTSTLDRASQTAALRAWGERLFTGLRGAPCQDPVLPAVLHTVRAFDLDPADFERFLDAMAADLTVDRYPTYHDLCGYMEGSAAVSRVRVPRHRRLVVAGHHWVAAQAAARAERRVSVTTPGAP